MNTSDFLRSHGWRFIGTKRVGNGTGEAKFWDHPEHQHDWGMFTTTDAVKHQKEVDKNKTCDCIKPQ